VRRALQESGGGAIVPAPHSAGAFVRLRRILPLVFALAAAGCAGRTRADDAAASGPAERQRNVMSIQEIQEGAQLGIGNLYDLVLRFHPEWLRTVRASATAGTASPTIWLDLQRIGSVGALRQMPLGGVTLMRYLTPPEARGELGFDNPGGAIVVSMI
jgi:hypothetical protein